MDSILGVIILIAFGHTLFAPVVDRLSDAYDRRRYEANR